METTTRNAPERKNVQGLILKGYTHPYSCHLLFQLPGSTQSPGSTPTELSQQQTFFKALYSHVQSAEDWGVYKPVSMLNIGLTFNGISKLDPAIIRQQDLQRFPVTFREGPASGGSQQSLGDNAGKNNKSNPQNWWNGQGDAVTNNLDCIVHIYSLTEEDLEILIAYVLDAAKTNGLTEFIPLLPAIKNGRLYQSIVDKDPAKIHFGYTDGISEPSLKPSEGTPSAESNNNFVIGYPQDALTVPGPTGEDTASIFAKDGCYNGFRVIHQDVAAFNRFLKNPTTDPAVMQQLQQLKLETSLEEWLAAKMCGRWRNGSPLMLSPDKPAHETSHEENFNYSVTDASGHKDDITSSLRCPFSAHTRVANPRDQQMVAAEGTFVPRIVRRGVPYGPTMDDQVVVDDGQDRGLIGLFLCGDLAGQFEKIYGWMNNNNFSGKEIFSVRKPPQDALLGDKTAANSDAFPGTVTSFIIPVDANNKITIPTLPNFLVTRGTAYCLLPSMETLGRMAGV
ncbi:Dyp-type peroxidase [Taibaiella soli]|uniref:Peroxidase n=1 Tax=Taibaiella soli TaxID=1649169 RepID=A0A2W2A955_9BACT|nr:hypothetical protein [Taibaiella soli]PZF71875.1 hypothetical protein DN068_17630 [Taibaiella soli]